jgi:anti-anti-sigma factor
MTNALLDGVGRGELGFAVEAAIEGDVRVAWLSGELDLATAPRLAPALAETTGMMRPRLVLDLSNLDFLDAAGLGAIVGARNSLRSRSGELTLRSPSRFAARVLEIGGLAGLVSQSAPDGAHQLASEQKWTPAA